MKRFDPSMLHMRSVCASAGMWCTMIMMILTRTNWIFERCALRERLFPCYLYHSLYFWYI